MKYKQITLYTADLMEMRNFYERVLEHTIVSYEDTSFSLQIGSTVLSFEQTRESTEPFYHFAFDVPANQFQEAKAWIEERVSLTRDNGKDHVYFSSIDASSIYFEDPSGNVVEWICRFSHSYEETARFHPRVLQCVSEMSLVVADKSDAAEKLLACGIPSRDGEAVPDDGLTFMGHGDEAVYFLLVQEKRIWYFSTQEAKIHPSHVVLEDGRVIETTRDGQLICTGK